MARVEVDLDRPAEFRYGEVEPDIAVAGKFDAVLANEPANPGPTQCLGDADFGM
jgi:hypothetical protein